MKPTNEILAVESRPPLMGLYTSIPSDVLGAQYSPRLNNVYIRDGIVRRRAGSHQLGRRLVGKVLAITEFGELGQEPYTVVLTTHRQYAYNPTTKDWKDLTPNQSLRTLTSAVTTGGAGVNYFQILGDWTASFPVGRIFPVVGGANQEVYTVVSATFVTGTHTRIVVQEVIPSTNVSGSQIVLADDFNTLDGETVNFVTATDVSGHRLIVTNNNNRPRIWSGNLADKFATWSPNLTNFQTCKTLEIFNEHLFMGNVVTLDREPQLIAWSSAGDFDEFLTGDAGVQLLYQLNEIHVLRILGDRLVIYSRDAVMTGVAVGQPAIFAFEVVIPDGLRLASHKAVVSINVGHVFASEENFYLFDGTRGLRVLSDPVWNDYKETKDHANISKIVLLNDFAKRTLFFAVPDTNGNTTIWTAFYDVFDLSRIIWSKEQYLDNVSAWGFFTNRNEQLLWEDASWEAPGTTWENELGLWGEEGEQLNFAIRAYGTPEGRVLIVTEGALSDRGTVPTQLYETIDFVVPQVGYSLIGRWTEIEIEAWGTQVNVITSKDQGQTYQGQETVVLDTSPGFFRIPIDVSSRTLRVKFITTGSNFSLRSVRLWVRPGGPR